MSMDYNRFHIAVEFKNQKAAYAQFTLINEIDVKLVGNRNLLADVANMEELLAALPYGFQPDCFDGGCIWDIWEAEEEEEEITDFEDLVREGDFSQIASVVLVADHDGEPWGLEWEKYTLSPYDVTSGRIKRQWNGSKRESVPRGEDYIFETLLPGVKKCIFSGWNNEPKEELPKAVRSTTALGGSFDKEFEYTLREEDEDVFIITFPRGIYITAYKGTDPVPVVPETVDGYPVIAVNSFGSNAYVTDAVIPQGIKVYDNSFKDCPNIRAKNGFTIVAGYLMSYTGNVSQVIIPEGVHTILSDVFKNNDSVQTVILPESIRHIESCTFEECKNLQSINFPEGLREIEFHAFQNTALTEVSFPKSLGKIGERAFCRCESLEKIQIFPNTVCESGAFSGYKNIEKLSRDDGIVLVNGTMFSIDIWKHKKYIHCPDGEIRVRIPADVIRIDGDFCFNAPGNILDEMTITDAMEYINSSDFFLSGIEKFRIVSAETGELLWETDRFASCSNLLTDFEPFEDFCERLEEDGIASVINTPIKQKRKPAAKKNPQPTQKPELKDDLHNREKIVAEEESQRAESAKQWMAEYGQYIEESPVIDFNGTLFVFSGLSLHADEKDHPIVQQVIAKGGQYRAKVSGLTNYLVVDPGMAGGSKVKNAIEQKNKGKNVRIILLEDLENALGGGALAGYKKRNDVISEAEDSFGKKFLVNNEWTFEVPFGVRAELNAKLNNSMEQYSLTNPVKPMVLTDDDKFNVALDKFFSFFSATSSVDDCRYDNRFDGSNSANSQKIVKDGDDLYVDVLTVSNWPMPTTVEIRVRGEHVTPFDFSGFLEDVADYEWDTIKEYLMEIANSIELLPAVKKSSSTKKTSRQNDNPNFIITDGVLTHYIGHDNDIIIPDGVIEIADNTFSGKAKLTSVVVPEGVKVIGNRAFENCVALEHVQLPNSLEAIGAYAFVDCHKLKSIHLSDRINYIPSSVFSECFELQDVILPQKLEGIDAFAFKNCREFTNIVIPNGTTEIGLTSFVNCRNLKDIYIPASVTAIHDNFTDATPFDGCDLLTIHCPEGSYAEQYAQSHSMAYDHKAAPAVSNSSPVKHEVHSDYFMDGNTIELWNGDDRHLILPSGTKKIGKKAFCASEEILSVSIPEGVIEIEDEAFRMCKNLQTVIIPQSIEKIGTGAFEYCTALKEIEIPGNVGRISEDCFANCEKLERIYIGDGVKEIGNNAFNWGNIRELSIPGSVKKIGAGAFVIQRKLKKVYLSEGIEIIGEEAFPPGLQEINIPASVRSIGKDAIQTELFAAIYTVEGSYGEKWFKERMFQIDKGHLYGVCAGLKHIDIPEKITVIDCYALRLAGKCLESITLPEGLKEIDDFAFFGCEKLEKLVIPNSVKRIGVGAFARCPKLKDITLPKSIKTIEDNAFAVYRDNLSVHREDGTPVEGINFYPEEFVRDENGALYAYIGTESVVTIPEDAGNIHFLFNNSTHGITDLTVPGSLEKVTMDLAGYNRTIERITLLSGMKTIGSKAFKNCSTLKEIHFPKTLNTIENSAFDGCSALKCVELPKMKVLERKMFCGCSALEQVSLPKGLQKIMESAFEDCCSIKEICLPQSLKVIEESAFAGCRQDLHINTSSPAAEKFAAEHGFHCFNGTIAQEQEYILEQARLAEEAAREQARIAEEEAKRKAEEARIAEEKARQQAEEARIAKEKARKQAEEARIAEEKARYEAKKRSYQQACDRFATTATAIEYLAVIGLLEQAGDYEDARKKRQLAEKLREKAGKLQTETSAVKNKEKEITAAEKELSALGFLQFGKKKELKTRLEALQAEQQTLQANVEAIRKEIADLRSQW